jgi:hypothetical protein
VQEHEGLARAAAVRGCEGGVQAADASEATAVPAHERAAVCTFRAVRAERRALMLLAAAAVVLAALMGFTGATELVLYGGPLLFITGLLLSGRFIGEERILARRRVAPARQRAARLSWSRLPERPLASLLERSASLLRGPPAPAAA